MEERKQESVKAHPTSISIVEPVPAEIDAGSDMALKIRVLCASGCNLLGGRIRIRDNQGDVVTEADLHSFDGTNNATNVFTVRVPVIPGEYIWSADFLAVEEENILHQESSLTFSFQVKPHQISLSIWGVPSPVSKGEKFKINIGAKCSAGCSLAGLPFRVEDSHHTQLAAGKLGGEILPQTNGIYWTEVELSAPCDEELHRWFAECMITPEELALPHQTSSESFLFRTTKPPEHMVTVEVTRRGDVIPVEDAYIMIGMYKTSTDKEGIARLEVPGGKQELTVTKDDYLTFQTTVEINEDTSVKAELEFFQVF